MMATSRRSLLLVMLALGWMSLVARGTFASVCRETGGGDWQTSQQVQAQTANGTNPTEPERSLPDIPALMHLVEVNQKTSEAIEKDYLYRFGVDRTEVRWTWPGEEDRD
jgi:hypothetical protein